ncbi:hypothetical protein BSFA1_76620 (plasmid) [Burkholderia sp. SFA1]|nr:hypothetical protein BSFA1_76620 [Burkholderia sp. SFA1]
MREETSSREKVQQPLAPVSDGEDRRGLLFTEFPLDRETNMFNLAVDRSQFMGKEFSTTRRGHYRYASIVHAPSGPLDNRKRTRLQYRGSSAVVSPTFDNLWFGSDGRAGSEEADRKM